MKGLGPGFFLHMETSLNTLLVPVNTEGKKTDLFHAVTENSIGDAIKTFERAHARLLEPQCWHELAGMISARFSIDGKDRIVHVNDHIKIDIPGPGPSAGEGFDWVRVEFMDENVIGSADESFGIKVRACNNPAKVSEGVAHFFTGHATSSFLIQRNEKTVTASYHGRNEIPNTSEVKLTDKIRNAMVATAAISGISELQWKALLNGLLQKDG